MNGFITAIVDKIYPKYKNKEILPNDCKYLTPDGGCSKIYQACPSIITDNMDMTCGGVCYEKEEPTEGDEDK